MVTKGRKGPGPFAVMGNHYQPVSQAQVLGNMLDYGMDPQTAWAPPPFFEDDGGTTGQAFQTVCAAS
jgi:gamma-glutamyltranspeptidase